MSMKKLSILIIAILVLGATAYAQAKFGTINSQEILQKTKKGKNSLGSLDKIKTAGEKEIKTRQAEIADLEKQLKSPALNQDSRHKKARTLQDKKIAFKRFVEDAELNFRKKGQTAMMALEKEIVPIIREYGKANGFTLIFDVNNPGLAYFDKATDVTADIIKAVDAKFPK